MRAPVGVRRLVARFPVHGNGPVHVPSPSRLSSLAVLRVRGLGAHAMRLRYSSWEMMRLVPVVPPGAH